MAQLFDSLKSLMNSERISRVARVVDEKEGNVSTASSAIIASFLGVMLKNGNTPQIRNILDEAGNLDILSCIGDICDEKAPQDQLRIGDNFTQHLLGDKAADFSNPIAAKAGISKPTTNRLVSIIAPIIAGYLGNKLVKDNWSFQKVLNQIENERNAFAPLIPADLIRSFGLSSVLNTNNAANKNDKPEKEKKGGGWITWVIIILLLLLLLFWWRSCRNNNNTAAVYETGVITDTVRPMPGAAMTPATPVLPADSAYGAYGMENREMVTLDLPNGQTIRAYDGGMEEDMLDFLKSGDYKTDTPEELRDKWFEFDNLSFQFGSSTEFTQGSRAQLDNIIAMLRNYKDAKVQIAGFADRRGTEQANMEVSKERAKTIENLLEQAGLGNQVVKVEGLGDEYAKHSASDPNSLRAEDRNIALRFVR